MPQLLRIKKRKSQDLEMGPPFPSFPLQQFPPVRGHSWIKVFVTLRCQGSGFSRVSSRDRRPRANRKSTGESQPAEGGSCIGEGLRCCCVTKCNFFSTHWLWKGRCVGRESYGDNGSHPPSRSKRPLLVLTSREAICLFSNIRCLQQVNNHVSQPYTTLHLATSPSAGFKHSICQKNREDGRKSGRRNPSSGLKT